MKNFKLETCIGDTFTSVSKEAKGYGNWDSFK